MIKAILKRTVNNKFTTRPKVRTLGKKGRQQRMFERVRKLDAIWESCVVKQSRPQREAALAESVPLRSKPLIDIANYNVFKGKTKPNHVRAKQPPQMRRR